jgi:membrane protein implicated in regulation of membrane protease activity
MHMATVLLAIVGDANTEANAEAARALRDFLISWPAQAALAALYVGLAVLVFARVTRDWDDGPARRYCRGAVVALGVFIVLEVVLGQALLGVLVWPVWLLIIELLWLFALWLYYFIRFMTRQRSGPGDLETQRRGAALDGTISRLEQERRGGEADGASADGPATPR